MLESARPTHTRLTPSRCLWALLLLSASLLGLAGYRGCCRWRSLPADAAPLTPSGKQVNALRAAAQRANLVICVLDAARADHIGCYGYPRETTPNIDALAASSLRFDRHFTQYVSTKPSTASLMTGQYSDTHLVTGDRGLLPDTFTMARGLRAAGFRTALFSSNPNSSPGMGIGLDFRDRYDQTSVKALVRKWEEWTRPEPLLKLFEWWLTKHRRSRFFVYMHLDPPHQPYQQPEEMTALFRGQTPPRFQPGAYQFPVAEQSTLKPYPHVPLLEWVNLYDANLRYADWAVGELLRMLEEAGVLENTLFVLTADHGEAFGEHGYFWHERGVYDELTRIPLIIKWPGEAVAPRVVMQLTETVDVLPTVFDAFRVRYPKEGVQGRSLLPLIAGLPEKAHDYAFARSDGDPPSYLVRSLDHALILYGNGRWRALYDLRADPGQRHNVITQQSGEARRMLAAFGEFARGQRRPPLNFLDPGAILPPPADVPAVGASPEVKKQLRGLGYLR